MRELEYPFDAEYILKKKNSLRKKLISQSNGNFLKKKIAILGGETTRDIKLMLELFLLNYGIEPSFYESEYNQWYEDGAFPNMELEKFSPDLVYICTCVRSIYEFPQMGDSKDVFLFGLSLVLSVLSLAISPNDVL